MIGDPLHEPELLRGPLTSPDTAFSLLLVGVMVLALLAADTWRTHRKEVPVLLNAVLATAGAVALAWPGEIDPFVYQRF